MSLTIRLLLGLFGASLIILGLWARRMNSLAANWPTVPGTVVASELVSQGEDAPNASIKYTYEVDGVAHSSNRIAYSGNWSNEDKELVVRYPAGSKVLVHYDPRNHSRAVIDIERRSVWAAFAAAGTFFVFLALAHSV